MTDRMKDNEPSGDQQLFKNMDEQERIYAPQEVPGAVDVPEEVDQRGTGAAGRGDAPSAGVIPIRPDTGINQPLPVPIVSRDRDDNEGARDTTQGKG